MGDKVIFARVREGLASEAAIPKTVMIDATYAKAHRTATSLRSKNGVPISFIRRVGKCGHSHRHGSGIQKQDDQQGDKDLRSILEPLSAV